jgi:signal transduction histidine kinase
MSPEEHESKIQALSKANRILEKRLQQAQRQVLELDEVNQRQESLLRQVLKEIQESQTLLADLNEDLEQRVEQRTTELQQVLHNLQEMHLQVVQSEKMSALGNLVAGVAHEINNPVGFIAGNLDATHAGLADLMEHLHLYQQALPEPSAAILDHAADIDLDFLTEDIPKMVTSMQTGCDRIQTISQSLRLFSRSDTIEKIAADLHAGLDSTLMILQHRLKSTPTRPAIQVIKRYGDIPPVKCFLGQLNQVFMNILANAIDALEEENQTRSFAEIQANPNCITIQTALADPDTVTIQISDNGIGMPESVRQKIFDHLFTTKSVGQGTGLGLSIARHIVVEKHSGGISVSSSPQQGTQFVIHLPINLSASAWERHR